MTRKLNAHQIWFRESNSWPARRFRRWAQNKDLDWWADAVGMAVGIWCVVVVFAAIVISESIANGMF